MEEPIPDDVAVLSLVDWGNRRFFGSSISSAPRSPRLAATASISSVLLPVPVVELESGLVKLFVQILRIQETHPPTLRSGRVLELWSVPATPALVPVVPVVGAVADALWLPVRPLPVW